MIDIKALEKNQIDPLTNEGYMDGYRRTLKGRGEDESVIETMLALNQQRKKLITDVETRKSEQNKFSQEIGIKKKQGLNTDELMKAVGEHREGIKELEEEVQSVDLKLHNTLARLPNKLHPSVPIGRSAEENQVVRTVGTPTKFSFKAEQHFEIGERLGLLDFERAGKVTGARFAFLRKGLAHLERALISFMLDLHTREHGYSEILPPFMVNADSMFGTNQLPKFADDSFRLEQFGYYLIPTAEVPVTNFYRDEILDEMELPQKFAAYSPCFRSEAGSHGRDTRGLIRQHQFNKVEMVKFTHPNASYEEHEKLVLDAEQVLKRLELPYRTMLLCSGDIGFGAAKCYDIEVWLPGPAEYREISSCSNFEDFQARRANIRFKSKGGKPQFVHTINGSGLAIGRTSLAILENYQTEDGRVRIPKVLQPYMHGAEYLS